MEESITLLEVDALDALEHQIWACGKCLFFSLENETAGIGECRRESPIIDIDTGYARWPLVEDNIHFWCGESKPTAEALKKMRAKEAAFAAEAPCVACNGSHEANAPISGTVSIPPGDMTPV